MSVLWPYLNMQHLCPNRAEHRGPEGPNEDIGICPECGTPAYSMRPSGEEFGGHLEDCSLPQHHKGYCVGGGSGHPPPRVMKG